MTLPMKCPRCDWVVTLDDSTHAPKEHCDKCGASLIAHDPNAYHGQDKQDEGIQEGVRLRSPRLQGEGFLSRRGGDGESAGRPGLRASPSSSATVWVLLGSGCLCVLFCVIAGGMGLAVWFAAGAVPNPAPPSVVQQSPTAVAPLHQPSLPALAKFFVAKPSCLSLSGDGTRLAVGSSDKTVRIFDVRTREEITDLAGHDGSIHSVALASDGQLVASAGKDRLIRIWNIARKEPVHTISTKCERPVVRFLPDSKTLAIAGGEDGVALLDVQTKAMPDHLKYGREVVALDITPDGNYLAMANQDIRVWDLRTRKEVIRLDGHRGQIEAVALSADGQVIVSGSADATIKIWDVKTGKERRTIRHRRSVLSLVMTPDGKLLASAGLTEGTIRLWDARDGRQVTTLDTFGPLLIGREGKTLLTGTGSEWVTMWDLTDLAGR